MQKSNAEPNDSWFILDGSHPSNLLLAVFDYHYHRFHLHYMDLTSLLDLIRIQSAAVGIRSAWTSDQQSTAREPHAAV